MERLRPSIKSLLGVICAPLVALLPVVWFWGFTVDDALISTRVAHQIATGHGYRFNANGPVVDAVTPLGWAHLLVPFAAVGSAEALLAAKWLGTLAWLGAVAWLGGSLARLGGRALCVGLALLLVSGPLAAWSVAGMETGLVLGLTTVGLSSSGFGRCALGLAAGLRPELLPWVFCWSVGNAGVAPGSTRERWLRGARAAAWSVGPFLAVAVTRTWLFGAAYPLSVLAKPSDATSGLRYALGALAFSGAPWLLVAGPAYRRARPRVRVAALAALVHLAVLVLVGGDWMPLYRLFVPVLPSLILAGAELAESAPGWSSGLRLGAAVVACVMVDYGLGPRARQVGTQRAELIAGAAPVLAPAARIATLDVGWVGAASAATIVDLAGVTDPSVARLAGGHTSKRIPDDFLEARDIDALVLLAEAPKLADWPELRFARAVEARVSGLAGVERFQPAAVLPLRGTSQAYVVLLRSR